MSRKIVEMLEVGHNRYVNAYHHCKVINRKKYDTSTSELLMCEYVPSSYEESAKLIMLLKKKNGEFFSYIVEYASYNINCRYPIEDWRITPLSEEQAMDLVEQYSEGSIFIEIFGEVEE